MTSLEVPLLDRTYGLPPDAPPAVRARLVSVSFGALSDPPFRTVGSLPLHRLKEP